MTKKEKIQRDCVDSFGIRNYKNNQLDEPMKNLAEIKKLAHEIKEFAERVIALEEPTVEGGQYWKSNCSDRVYRVNKVSNSQVYQRAINEERDIGDRNWTQSEFVANYHLLSDSEVQQALIEEAERRGLAKGKKIKSARSEEDLFWNREGKIHYKQATDELIVSGANEGFAIVLYRQGGWAEISADEWEVVEEPFRQVTNGERCISTISPVPPTKEEAETIAKALNR